MEIEDSRPTTNLNFDIFKPNALHQEQFFATHSTRVLDFIDNFFQQSHHIVYRQIERSVLEIIKSGRIEIFAKSLAEKISQVFSAQFENNLLNSNATDNKKFSFLSSLQQFFKVGRIIFNSFENRFIILNGHRSFQDWICKILKEAMGDRPEKLSPFLSNMATTFHELSVNPSEESKTRCQLIVQFFENVSQLGNFSTHYTEIAYKGFFQELNGAAAQKDTDFLAKVKHISDTQEHIYEHYLKRHKNDLLTRLNCFLYREWLPRLTDALIKAIDSNQIASSSQILSIFIESNHAKDVQSIIGEHITRKFDDCRNLRQLLDFLGIFTQWRTSIFAKRDELWKEHSLSIDRMVNKSNKIDPLLFASSFDHFVTEKQNEHIESSMNLLHMIAEKDKYIRAIYKYFSKSILGQRNVEIYMKVYLEFRRMYGDEMLKIYTNLLKDIEDSKEALAKVKTQISEKVTDLTLIDKNHWPKTSLDWKVPMHLMGRELESSANRMKQVCLKKGLLQKLDFMADHSTVEIEVEGGGRSKVFQMKLKYALVFFAFENRNEWALDELGNYLQLKPEILKKLIEKMIKKYNVIDIDGQSVKVKPGWWQSLSLGQTISTKKTGAMIDRQLGADIQIVNKADAIREIDRAIKAFIVKETKTKGQVRLDQLSDGVASRFKIPVEGADLAPLIEELLSNDFIQRNTADPALFEYKS